MLANIQNLLSLLSRYDVYGIVRILPTTIMPIHIVQYVIYMNFTVLSQISIIFFHLQYT